MDVVCIDKTGTITQNQLKLAKIKSFTPYTDSDLLYYAALASDESTQDPIDQAILADAKAQNLLHPYQKESDLLLLILLLSVQKQPSKKIKTNYM